MLRSWRFDRSHQLQSWAKFPLLLAADIEEGVGQRFAGATWFGPPMAIAEVARHDSGKADRYAEQMGAVTAIEARAIGLNWILAPVVDVNNNPDNPVINVRVSWFVSKGKGKSSTFKIDRVDRLKFAGKSRGKGNGCRYFARFFAIWWFSAFSAKKNLLEAVFAKFDGCR